MRDTIEMAREAGFDIEQGALLRIYLETFATLVRADERSVERETCAELVESLPPVGVYRQLERATFKDAAIAIRARGNT